MLPRCAPLSPPSTWDVIIADYQLPEIDAPAALAVLHESGLDLPFLVVSGAMGEDLAVAIMKAGAHDYLNKDSLARLAPAVRREIREAQVRQERRQAEESLRLALIAAEEANHRYHVVAEHGRTIIWEVDAEGLLHLCQPHVGGCGRLPAGGIDRQEALLRSPGR